MKLPGTVGSLIPWWAVFIAILMILGLLISVSGCATSYWSQTRAPQLVLGVIEVEKPCGHDGSDGCPNYRTGMIELRRGLKPLVRDCVLKHERHHFDGYDHPALGGYAADCGDGTMVPFTN